MKSIRLIAVIALLCAANTAWAQLDTLYAEYFTDGQDTLDWFDPWGTGSLMGIVNMPGNPSGDGWVGRVGNDSSAQVGTMLAGDLNMFDYEVEAQIYCTVSAAPMGAYHGVVARWDSTLGYHYYYLHTDFDTDQRIRLRKYPAGGMGETIREWTVGEIPGGVPAADGWHHMALKCAGDSLWAFWDGDTLPGYPFIDNYLSRGFFGIYVFRGGVMAETFCDDIIVLGDAGPQPFDFIAQESHILDTAGVELELRPAEGDSLYFSLDWQVLGDSLTPAFLNTLYLDGAEFYREVFAGGTVPDTSYTSQTDTLWGATLGWHTLTWTLDETNNVLEGNENNNVLVDSFLVLLPGAFDLAVESSWYADPDTIPYDNDTLNIGDEVLFVLDWLVPMGEGFSAAFNITMDLDGDPYYLISIISVQSGDTNRTVAGPWTATEGFHYFEWMLDSDNLIDEFNENNNSTLNGFWAFQPAGLPWDQNTAYQPQALEIVGAYPNPFNPAITLQYENALSGLLSLTVYDVAGRKVAVLADGFHPAGVWDVTWEAEGIAGGIYFAVLEGDGHRSVKPLLLVK